MPTSRGRLGRPRYPLMIRTVAALSLPNLCPTCESEETTTNRLIFLPKIAFEILFFGPCTNLRSRSIEGEQNALSRRFPGRQTESAAIRPAGVGACPARADRTGTSAVVRLSQ